VISISIASSAIGRWSASTAPGGRSESSTMMPAWSSPMPTSSSARIIPLDRTPRSFASPSFVPSGMTAPGSATATVWPAATLGAPQTIVRDSPLPSSTTQTVSRSASGCFSASSTRPTTNAAGSPTPVRCRRSSLTPAIVRESAISSALVPGSQ
jgi:hypothetical protein